MTQKACIDVEILLSYPLYNCSTTLGLIIGSLVGGKRLEMIHDEYKQSIWLKNYH